MVLFLSLLTCVFLHTHSLSLSLAGSTPNTSNMVTQLKFLEKQLARLKDPATASLVTSDLCRVRDTLTSPGNLRVFMATDIDKLSTPLQPWEIFMGRANSKRYALHILYIAFTLYLYFGYYILVIILILPLNFTILLLYGQPSIQLAWYVCTQLCFCTNHKFCF